MRTSTLQILSGLETTTAQSNTTLINFSTNSGPLTSQDVLNRPDELTALLNENYMRVHKDFRYPVLETQNYCYSFYGPRTINSLDFIKNHPKKNELKILDVGSGKNFFVENLQKIGAHAEGLSAYDYRAEEQKESKKPYIDFQEGDAESLHKYYQEEEFNIIFSHSTVMHLTDPFGFLILAFSRLKQNGLLIVDYVNAMSLTTIEHRALIAYLIASGYKVFADCNLDEEINLSHLQDAVKISCLIIQKTQPTLILPVSYSSIKSDSENVKNLYYRFVGDPDEYLQVYKNKLTIAANNNLENIIKENQLNQLVGTIDPENILEIFTNIKYLQLTPQMQHTVVETIVLSKITNITETIALLLKDQALYSIYKSIFDPYSHPNFGGGTRVCALELLLKDFRFNELQTDTALSIQQKNQLIIAIVYIDILSRMKEKSDAENLQQMGFANIMARVISYKAPLIPINSLQYALLNKNYQLLEILVAGKTTKSMLEDYMNLGTKINIMELFGKYGDPKAIDHLSKAVSDVKTPAVQLKLLNFAAAAGNESFFENLTTISAEVDSNGFSILHNAIFSGKTTLTATILKLNPKLIDIAKADIGTPLQYACYLLRKKINSDLIEIVKQLLAQGAKVLLFDKRGCTPLHYACGAGQEVFKLFEELSLDFKNMKPSLLQILVQSTADKNFVAGLIAKYNLDINAILDDEKNTALHLAYMIDNTEMRDFLLAQGAKVDAKNDDGKIPQELAPELSDEESESYPGMEPN